MPRILTAQKEEASLSLEGFLNDVGMQRKVFDGNLTVLLTPLYSDFYLGASHEPVAVLELEFCPLCSFRCWCHHVGVSWFICLVLHFGRCISFCFLEECQQF